MICSNLKSNMTDVDNEVFGGVEDDSQTRLKEKLELKEHRPNNDMSISMEGSKPQEKKSQNDENFFIKWNLKTRMTLKKCLLGKSQFTRIFRILLVNGAAVAFLAASLIHNDQRDLSKIDWCNGVGFLWVLYVLIYVGLLYSFLKKFVGKSFYSFLNSALKRLDSVGTNKYFQVIFGLAPVVALATFVIVSPGKSGRRIFSFLGMIVFIALGYLFSKHPAHIKWRPVICGIVLQFGFGLLTIQWELGKNILDCLGSKVTGFLQYSESGASFVFGKLATPEENEKPIFAFSVLPLIYFLSLFINILSYYGVLQWFLLKIGWVVRVIMGTTVCESVCATASIFLGQTETPLLIKSYLKDLTKSEICAVLCAGWSTVAGVVMGAYIKFGVNPSHLIAASVMSAPASLSYSKLVYPETEESKTTVKNIILERETGANVLDAACKGALNAVSVIASITASIISFIAFISFLDGTLNWLGIAVGFQELSVQYILSKLFYPISFLMGVDVESLEDVAYLVGIKTVANEFQAYEELGKYLKAKKLSERSEIIATYALCGFSNFGSIGVAVGAFSAIEPRQRSTVAEVSMTAFIAANIVCFLTACVAGCLTE